jgi:hypothetical protein
MTSVSLDTIVDAIETTLGAAALLARSETYDELTEGIPDIPMLQVWPVSSNTDVTTGNDRKTFGAVRRVSLVTINADVYARQRSHIGEDMGALVPLITQIETILEAQTGGSVLFGLTDQIKAFRWRWEHVTFTSENDNYKYVGARFIIDIWTF